MRFVDEDVDVVAFISASFLMPSNLWIIEMMRPRRSLRNRSRRSARVSARLTKMSCCCISPSNLSHPTAQLPFEFGTVHNDDYGRVAELCLTLQNETCSREKRERLSRPLGVPDQPALLILL